MSYKVSAVIEEDENGFYAYCPELPGCQTQGATLSEATTNLREAIELYLETMTEEERLASVSREIYTTSLEVELV
ncbi:MAG: type II toxin-antitoxin system HicB family antitoxin [Bacteroidota bacterium]